MSDLDPAVAIDGIRQFFKLHATCGEAFYDMPDLPGRPGYRAVAACRCGDTIEFWLTGAALSPRRLLESALFNEVQGPRRRGGSVPTVPKAA